MFIAYKASGIVANIALLANVVLVAAVLLFEVTLTLPGMAGIVLTIGMAVDANVIIFEKIREEIRAGKSPGAAIDSGCNVLNDYGCQHHHILGCCVAAIWYRAGSRLRSYADGWYRLLSILAIYVTRLVFDAYVSESDSSH